MDGAGMNPPDNEELIDRLRRRDKAAFTQIVRTYEQPMLRTAYRIVGQQADAEEVRQTVLLKIWQSPDKIPAAQPFDYWIRRCVINESIEVLRRKERDVRRNSNSVVANLKHADPAEWTVEAENLRVALDTLEPEQRAILSLRFDEECTIREIGNILEQPHTTVQSRLNRAIHQLRELLNSPVKQVE